MKYADLGSISTGTLRTEDLLPAFINALDALLKRQPKGFARAPYRKALREAVRAYHSGNVDWMGDMFYEVEQMLHDFAPPYCFFGTHRNDGADYGFWVIDSVLEEFDGLVVESTAQVPWGYRGEVLYVNDHGNATLFVANAGRKLREIWSVV